eukprot:SAG22_NODE_13986_length_388_cov_1.079585_1_plen_98_part_10
MAAAANPQPVCRVAAICGVYRPHSHADVGIGKLLHGYPTDEGLLLPRVQVVSLYLDQVSGADAADAQPAAVCTASTGGRGRADVFLHVNAGVGQRPGG